MIITTINEWKKHLQKINEEELPEINSDKTISLGRYETDIKYYNDNTNSLEKLLDIEDAEEREKKANELINNNKYLGLYWKLIKNNKSAEDMEKQIQNSDLSSDELRNMEDVLNDIKLKANDIDQDLQLAIKKDLEEIKKM